LISANLLLVLTATATTTVSADGSTCAMNIDCLTDPKGENYKGNLTETRSGYTCQKWASQKPHKHSAGINEKENFCRNPDGEPTIWCYTTDPAMRWDFCDVKLCKDCDTGACLVHMNTNFPGRDIIWQVTNSSEECRSLCEEVVGCNAYTYDDRGNKKCYLKSSISRSTQHNKMISGKPCKKGSCPVHPNTDYPGNDINLRRKDKTNSYKECRTLCEEAEGCNAYTYHRGSKNCYLKSSISRKAYKGGTISGKPCKKCKPEVCKPAYALDADVLSKMKEEYLALDKDNIGKVRQLLPDLMLGNVLSPEEVGIAKMVTSQTKYPLALLTGNDVNLVRLKSKSETINGTVNKRIGKRPFPFEAYRVTGFYAAPGEIVTVTVPKDLVHKVSVEIGVKGTKSKIISYKRFLTTSQKFASPFGGVISLKLDDKDATTKIGMFEITVDNAVEAPYFVQGQTTNEDWKNLRKSAAPWAVLRVPGQVHMYVETHMIHHVKDMSSVMSSLKKFMDEVDHMLGIPFGFQPGEERVHYNPYCHYGGFTQDWPTSDGWICSGAGYSEIHPSHIDEILTPNTAYFSLGDKRGRGGRFVLGHELGHRGCYYDLPAAGGLQYFAEVVRYYLGVKDGFYGSDWLSANTFSVLTKLMNFKRNSKGKPCYEYYLSSHIPKGIPYKVNGYQNCFTILYRLPFREFGVDIYRKALTATNKMPDLKWAKTSVKTERLVDLYCKATQHNLIPFFNFFNIHVNDSVATPCKAQPKAKMLTGYVEIATCLMDENTSDAECTNIKGLWPTTKGFCFLSGTCESNPDKGGNTTVMDRVLDLSTRDNEFRCHQRAVATFKKCGNGRDNPINGTYILKDGTSSTVSVPFKGNCYYDRRKILPKFMGYTSSMFPSECNKKCAEENYSYFGVGWQNECRCGNMVPNMIYQRNMSECSKTCKMGPSLKCEWTNHVNIWKVCKDQNCKFAYE